MDNAVIQTVRCDDAVNGDLCIDVYYKGEDSTDPIRMASQEVLPFVNSLTNEEDAYVHFYNYKGGQLVPDFCGPGTPNPIKVEYGLSNKYECNMPENTTTKSLAYEYEVTASGHTKLDPVIIIKPGHQALIFDFPVDSVVIGVIGVIGGIILGLIAGKMAFK